MDSKVYITLLGRSTWALINSFYAAVDEGYRPDSVHIFAEESYGSELEPVEEGLLSIGEGFGFEPEVNQHVVDDVDLGKAGREIEEVLKDFLDDDDEVFIDITPGRKALVAAALLSAIDFGGMENLGVDRIFYLAIETTEDADRPYYMIPHEIQELTDIVEDIRGGGDGG